MKSFPNFNSAIRWVDQQMRDASHSVKPDRWQSIMVSDRPESEMREILNVSFNVALSWNENPVTWQNDIEPNLPWAEDHFLERVSGEPLNPGVQWRNWPWALSADKHRTAEGSKFSHTYMERYWPKQAGYSDETRAQAKQIQAEWPEALAPMHGIRYSAGDLNDVINHLLGDTLTRQAYLPVWFPEDTGVVHGQRVPCTLGYHFIQRNGYFHSTYYIRSCDFYRHFRDDLYLSVRLQLWVLQELRRREAEKLGKDGFWHHIRMGGFTFHCVSMHMFINDWRKLYGTTK